jgi:hypothetical protein
MTWRHPLTFKKYDGFLGRLRQLTGGWEGVSER